MEYCPEVIAVEGRRYPTIAKIESLLPGATSAQPIPIPLDCSDGFSETFYGRPEKLLDPAIRGAQSAWGFVEAEAEARFATALCADLKSGAWDKRYGHLRSTPAYEGAMCLLVNTPA